MLRKRRIRNAPGGRPRGVVDQDAAPGDALARPVLHADAVGAAVEDLGARDAAVEEALAGRFGEGGETGLREVAQPVPLAALF